MAEQESRLAIVIDTAGAEARIKALKEQLKDLGGAADNAADDTADLGNSADRASRDTNRLNASAASGEKALDKMLHHRSGDLESHHTSQRQTRTLHHRSGDLENQRTWSGHLYNLHHRSGDL